MNKDHDGKPIDASRPRNVGGSGLLNSILEGLERRRSSPRDTKVLALETVGCG